MAGFQGIHWAPSQARYSLKTGQTLVEPASSKVYAVSRSIHYGLCLAFEGIRFRCRFVDGELTFTFFNLAHNLERFQRSIRYNLAEADHELVPSTEGMRQLFLRYLSLPQNRDLFEEMAHSGQQGYLRPFTFDEEQSIGVVLPQQPSIRLVAAGYDDYLGEPFSGVVVPQYVRACGVNGTGCLKLGINYLMSVKAIIAARRVHPSAASALFLDDRPYDPIDQRTISEWDSSCALIALTDNTFIKIPESPLILPSVTIRGICAILREWGEMVVERDVTYAELVDLTVRGELVTICSIGTAGILNRCSQLHLFDGETVRAVMNAQEDHPAFAKLREAKQAYWGIYAHAVEAPADTLVEEHRAGWR